MTARGRSLPRRSPPAPLPPTCQPTPGARGALNPSPLYITSDLPTLRERIAEIVAAGRRVRLVRVEGGWCVEVLDVEDGGCL